MAIAAGFEFAEEDDFAVRFERLRRVSLCSKSPKRTKLQWGGGAARGFAANRAVSLGGAGFDAFGFGAGAAEVVKRDGFFHPAVIEALHCEAPR